MSKQDCHASELRCKFEKESRKTHTGLSLLLFHHDNHGKHQFLSTLYNMLDLLSVLMSVSFVSNCNHYHSRLHSRQETKRQTFKFKINSFWSCITFKTIAHDSSMSSISRREFISRFLCLQEVQYDLMIYNFNSFCTTLQMNKRDRLES